MTGALVVAAVGLLLAFLGWTRPPTVEKTEQTKLTQTITFDYKATVPPSPAYQTTEVRAPDPVFRTQTNIVQVEFAYKGEPATITPEVRLSTSNGWRWTQPPGTPVDATNGEGTGWVTLDLNALQAQAEAGATAAGIPASDLTITVIPVATTSAGDFKPELPLTLTTQSLTLADGEESLVSDQSTDGTSLTVQPNSLSFLGVTLGVWPMRIVGLVLLVAGLVSWFVIRGRRTPAGVADMAVLHRHRELVIPVTAVTEHDMCIDVADADSLVRLAKRYALMILQVQGQGGADDRYYVQDESVTYRWSPGGGGSGGGGSGGAGISDPAGSTLLVGASPTAAQPTPRRPGRPPHRRPGQSPNSGHPSVPPLHAGGPTDAPPPTAPFGAPAGGPPGQPVFDPQGPPSGPPPFGMDPRSSAQGPPQFGGPVESHPRGAVPSSPGPHVPVPASAAGPNSGAAHDPNSSSPGSPDASAIPQGPPSWPPPPPGTPPASAPHPHQAPQP